MSLEVKILTEFFGIKNYEIKGVVKNEADKKIILELVRLAPCYCGKCGTVSGKRYDSSEQEFLIGTLNAKAIYARVKVYRVRCPFHGIVTEKHDISDGKKRYSKEVGKLVVHFTEKLDNKAAGKLLGISESTVYRIDLEELSHMQDAYLKDLPKPKHLGVDEIAYKRRHNYASVIYDFDKSKVLWLEVGRARTSLEQGYSTLGDSLKDVSIVAMDFWKAFENATRVKLPRAKIIYDRFHLSRLLSRAVDDERRIYQKQLDPEERGFIKRDLRWVLLKREQNLTRKNRIRLEDLKETNNRLYEMYLLKESFLAIFSTEYNVGEARKLLFAWIREVLLSDFEAFKRFAKSVLKRIRHILHWFIAPVSNAKAEGINNVIKTLLKRAYGYKNFEYLRMKILQKCGVLMNYATHTF